MNFHTAGKFGRGSLDNKSRAINVYTITRESTPSYFAGQWKLLELKRRLDKKLQTV
ncbi:MAG TPA: hypothetical protein QGF86_05740 [Nitrospinaceae bacterium]|jgi:hypothetical protein|nr:hypothetical protein [Nitrospinaceae bacterium]HJO00350.1 hypothetical protein [Nitrospinaceae bacterium]|tara:strand:- start:881 stop:1048 length:168 start_codon:yes stop_codon:yes gene_type:complete